MDKKPHFYFGVKPGDDKKKPQYNNPAFTVKRIANTLEISLELHNAAAKQDLADIRLYILRQGPEGELRRHDARHKLVDDLAIVATAGQPIMSWLRQPIPADPRGAWRIGPFTYELPFGTDTFILVATATPSENEADGDALTPPAESQNWAIWVSPVPESC